MLVSPIMPTVMSLVNRKRKLSSQINNSTNDIHLPSTKKCCLDSDVSVEHHENENMVKWEDQLHELPRMLRPQLLPKGGFASTKNPLTFAENSPDGTSNGVEYGRGFQMNHVNGYTQHITKHKIPRSLLKKNGTKSDNDEILSLSCTPSSYDSSESEHLSNLKGKIKQTDIGMKQPVKIESAPFASSRPYPITPQVSNVVLEGYVHRMANLNARACVAAYLLPDKDSSKQRRRSHGSKKRTKSKLICDSDTFQILTASSKQGMSDAEQPRSKPVVLNVNGIENVIPVITFGTKMPPCAVVLEGLDEQQDSGGVPYNTLGLLYNGDTLHPNARVFLEGSQELCLPSRVVPTLVPTRLSTVRRAAKKASSTGVVRRDKKQALKRKNNGWCPLGKPIKAIENLEGHCKKYYAGIKRRNEEIYIRDCVVIHAGTDKRKNPYVAKIGSIWREPDGALMMTTFWYYQSDDLEVGHTGIQCVEKEVLASQHHDVNSVACIEDKCYVVGLSQYCRYHASVLKSTVSNQISGFYSSVVPPLPTTTATLCHNQQPIVDDIHLIELDPNKRQQEDLGPSLFELQQVDPSLIFLCYRGFNHIAGKLQSGKAVLPKL